MAKTRTERPAAAAPEPQTTPARVEIRVLPGRTMFSGRDTRGIEKTRTHADGFYFVDAVELECPGFRKSVETREEAAAAEAQATLAAKAPSAGAALFDNQREMARARLRREARVTETVDRAAYLGDAAALLGRKGDAA